jgi:hypothetical protein
MPRKRYDWTGSASPLGVQLTAVLLLWRTAVGALITHEHSDREGRVYLQVQVSSRVH